MGNVEWTMENSLHVLGVMHYGLCERPENCVLSKKRFGVLLRASLFLGKWCGVATYFLYKKNKKKYKYKLHIQNTSLSLIE